MILNFQIEHARVLISIFVSTWYLKYLCKYLRAAKEKNAISSPECGVLLCSLDHMKEKNKLVHSTKQKLVISDLLHNSFSSKF